MKVLNHNGLNTDRYKRECAAYKKMDAIGDNKENQKYGIPSLLYTVDSEYEKILVMPRFEYSILSLEVQMKCTEETYLQIMLELVCI